MLVGQGPMKEIKLLVASFHAWLGGEVLFKLGEFRLAVRVCLQGRENAFNTHGRLDGGRRTKQLPHHDGRVSGYHRVALPAQDTLRLADLPSEVGGKTVQGMKAVGSFELGRPGIRKDKLAPCRMGREHEVSLDVAMSGIAANRGEEVDTDPGLPNVGDAVVWLRLDPSSEAVDQLLFGDDRAIDLQVQVATVRFATRRSKPMGWSLIIGTRWSRQIELGNGFQPSDGRGNVCLRNPLRSGLTAGVLEDVSTFSQGLLKCTKG